MLLQCHDRSSECVTHVGKATMPTRYGNFVAHAFRSKTDNNEYLALVMGDVCQRESVLTRLHSECLTGDVLGSLRCDCGEQLDAALRSIASEGVGALLYLRGHEGRGIGLCNKILAYGLQEQGRDTVDANRDLGLPDDAREYDCAASIVRQLGILSVRLMSNNPDKFQALQRHGIPVCERVDLAVALRKENERYIWAKRNRFGHYFDENELQQCPLSL